jgi:hypothetical protein
MGHYPFLLVLDYRRMLAQSGAELVCPPLPIRCGEFPGSLGVVPARPDFLA